VPSTFRVLAPLGAVALAAATLTLPAGSASAATWPGPVPLTGVVGAVEATNVAIAPDGSAVAALLVWDEATNTQHVVTASRPPRGTWSAPQTLSGPSVDSTEPAIAIGPDGTTTIAWRLAPTTKDFVVQATTRAPGHGWSPVQSLSLQSTDEYVSGFTNPEVRLAAATDGTVTAVWPQWITDPNPSDSHFEVQSATRSAAGAWTAPETLDDREWGYRTPELAAGPSGQIALVYGMASATADGVFVQTRQGAGPWTPRKRLGDQYWAGRPEAAYADDGTLGVLWASGFNTPTVSTLPPGGHWASPRVVSHVQVNTTDLHLAAGSSGFVATWTSDENGNYDDEHIYVATGGSTGPWATQPVALATSGSPVVTVKSDGTAVVMWLWRAPTTYDYAVQASVRPPGGAWESPSIVRDLPADHSSYQLALASGPGGSLAALWAESDALDVTTTYAVSQDPAAPDTGLITGPKRIKPGKKGSFAFTGPSGATYECRVDKTRSHHHGKKEAGRKRPVPWKACTSPFKVKTKKLEPGKHTVYVRAVQFGLTDPTPSARKFKVK
jgi:hypothetical protein